MRIRSQMVAGAAAAAAVGLTSLTVMSGPAHAAGPTRIAGTVTLAGGGVAPDIKVTALKLGTSGEWAEADNAVTGLDGTYQIGKFEDSGTYRIRFDDPSGSYETEFYKDQPRVDLAQDLDLVARTGKFENINAELGAAARFTGRVLDSSAAGIPNAAVTAYVRSAPTTWTAYQVVTTSTDGSYDLGGLPGGVYTLGFYDPASGVSEFWNNKAALDDADSLSVTNDGKTSGLDAMLATPVASTPTPTTAPAATPVIATTSTPAAPTTTSLKAMAVTKKPAIKGKAKVGSRLRVTPGTINPTAVARKVQWFAGGKAIKKATKRRFKVTTKQRGKKITVRVTLSAPGYTTLVVKTRPTTKVRS